jgi:hypothetical protein
MINLERAAKEDAAWWRSLLPIDWQLYGFDGRISCAVVNPTTGKVVDINGEFLKAIIRHHTDDTMTIKEKRF